VLARRTVKRRNAELALNLMRLRGKARRQTPDDRLDCGADIMTAEDVRELVEREIAGDWSQTNLHGCDLRRCLVPAKLLEYDDSNGPFDAGPAPVVWMWLVLEELPTDRSGYKIVFGETAGMFGLAVPGIPRDVFLGYYGSFLETYRAM
jgi:hypothetical protein